MVAISKVHLTVKGFDFTVRGLKDIGNDARNRQLFLYHEERFIY